MAFVETEYQFSAEPGYFYQLIQTTDLDLSRGTVLQSIVADGDRVDLQIPPPTRGDRLFYHVVESDPDSPRR